MAVGKKLLVVFAEREVMEHAATVHSSLMLASRTMRPYSSYCLRKKAASGTPHCPPALIPCAKSLLRTSGRLTEVVNQSASWSTRVFGVALGANRPYQRSRSRSL